MEMVKNIAAVVGCVLSCISLLALVCKPIRAWVVGFIVHQSGKSETDRKLYEMQKNLDDLKKMMEVHLAEDAKKREAAQNDRDALLCLLRNSITSIYYRYLPEKAIPAHQNKNVIMLYDAYDHEGGNTYVSTIVEDMRHWKVMAE